jgi:hypothetical protein
MISVRSKILLLGSLALLAGGILIMIRTSIPNLQLSSSVFSEKPTLWNTAVPFLIALGSLSFSLLPFSLIRDYSKRTR